MKNLLFVTNSLGFGGAEKMLAFVANALSGRGYPCTVINLNSVPGYVNEHKQTVDANVKVYTAEDVPDEQNKHIFKIKYIKNVASEVNADVLIGFTNFPNLYATIVGKQLHIPSIMSERGDPARTNGKSLKDRIMIFLINRANGGVFQTDGAMAFYGKGLQKRGQVIPNPIFLKGEIPAVKYQDREKTVVSVGRLDNWQKRLDVMLQAFKLFHKSHPEYILKLYGRGAQESEIRQWAVDLGIAEFVTFMGLTTQPMQDIATDGMFLITSDFEGISNALLEAMAVGMPCVSTDHTPGGARMLIQDHENGLLVSIGDVQGLAKAMCEFAENPVLAEKCGENARDVVNRFDPDKIIDMWQNYIEKVCG